MALRSQQIEEHGAEACDTTLRSPALPSSVVSAFRNDIQGLRAVAVVLVVAYHAGVLGGGFVGVDVFFVVSGYVITTMIRREVGEEGRLSLGRFYLRRVRRLLPALGLMLAAVSVASVFFLPVDAQVVAARTGVAAALVNANHYLMKVGGGGGYFGFDADTNPFLHTWSLSVEEQFYLVFPILFVVTSGMARRRRPGERMLVGVLAILALGSFVVGTWLSYSPVEVPALGEVSGYYPAAARAWEFLVGVLLVFIPAGIAGRLGRLGSPLVATGLAAIVASAMLYDSSTAFPGVAALLPVLGTVLVIVGGLGVRQGPVTRLLGVGPLQFLGNLSYSWYLWHWPLMVFASAFRPADGYVKVVAGGVSLVPAWVSYRFIENRLRHAAHPTTSRTVLLGVSCVSVPIFASMGLVAMNGYIKSGDAAPFADHVNILAGCEGYIPGGGYDSKCRWPVNGSRGTVVLVGDSNAGQYSEGFIAAANALEFDAVIATKSSCLVVEATVWRGETEGGCRRFGDSVLEYLVASRPRMVFLASSPLYLSSPEYTMAVDDLGPATSDEQAKSFIYADGLTAFVSRLTAVDIPVVLVHPIPILGVGWNPLKQPWLRLANVESSDALSTDRSVAERTRQAMFESQTIVASRTGALTADFFDLLCPGARCSAFDGTAWRYRDGTHISTTAALSLTAQFERIMQP